MHFTVHRVFNGHDSVIGSFWVVGNEIRFDSMADEMNASIFPAGPMAPMTRQRLQSLLDNHNKSVYITRA